MIWYSLGIEREVREAQINEPDPGTGPPRRLFVPTSVVRKVLQWIHISKFACHPGIGRTLLLTKKHFWWPIMDRDIKDYVIAFSICTCNKNNNQPAGLLLPLPALGRPWSHIALDFVTRLPPSEGNTVVCTIIDQFSKAAHFIPLTKLPIALETAQILKKKVFHVHVIPLDIVSDRGPQVTSQVWKAFCQALDTTVNLTSDYHPQSNGQTERCNKELDVALRCAIENNPSTWSQYLPWV